MSRPAYVALLLAVGLTAPALFLVWQASVDNRADTRPSHRRPKSARVEDTAPLAEEKVQADPSGIDKATPEKQADLKPAPVGPTGPKTTAQKPATQKSTAQRPGTGRSTTGKTLASPSLDPPPPPPATEPRVVEAPRPRATAAEAPKLPPQITEPIVTEPTPTEPTVVELNPRLVHLRDQVRQALAFYYTRPVNARDHTPWEAFHWILAYNVDAELFTQGPGGEKANVVGWLCFNRACRGQYVLGMKNGLPTGLYGVGLEGHTGQFMAILGQSRVMIDYPMVVEGRKFTVADLVEGCKLGCESGKDKELTFLLIGLSHYLHPNAVWKSRNGEMWSIPRLIHEEIAKPIRGAACGGTHRLMGLTYAVRKREQYELPIDGEYRRAQTYVNDYIGYTLRLQNSDGSFSTEWFTGRGDRDDIERKLQTTGHILEWIVFAVPVERLQDPQIVKAVEYVSGTLLENRQHAWQIGHLGHGLRSISLYDRRLFKPLEKGVPEVARRVEPSSPPPPTAIEESKDSDGKPVTGDATAGDKDMGVDGQDVPEDDPPPSPDPSSGRVPKQ